MKHRRLFGSGLAGKEREDKRVPVFSPLEQLRRIADLPFAGEKNEGIAEAIDLAKVLESAADLLSEGRARTQVLQTKCAPYFLCVFSSCLFSQCVQLIQTVGHDRVAQQIVLPTL